MKGVIIMKKAIKTVLIFSLLLISIHYCSFESKAAGAAKPDGVDREVSYEVLEVKGNKGAGGTPDSCGLFDGTQVNEWDTSQVMYWEVDSNYLVIDIKETCNIWRSGTAGWDTFSAPLLIYKWDGEKYNDVTNSIKQVTSRLTHKEWEKTIPELPAGKYYFKTSAIGYRIDSEWYLESAEASSASKNSLKVVLEPKEELQLSVTDDLDENTKLIWSSSDTDVAAVDNTGIVTAVKPGNAVITVKDKNGSYEESTNILVVKDAAEYRLAVDLKVSKACRLTIDDYTFSKKVTWTVLDTAIATVDSKGKVTAVSEGLTLVTAADELGNEIGQIYIRVRK